MNRTESVPPETIGRDEDKATRQRSPNYPAVGLREAVERTKRLLEKDGRAGAPARLAAVHIGFQSAHGQAMSVVAALKKFGLVEPMKDRLAPTQRAIEIINLPATDPRRLAALKDAALSPPIYRELYEQHKDTGLPHDDVLQSELITYRGFNPRSVEGFVKDFRETLDFSGLSKMDELNSASMLSKEARGEETKDLTPLPGAITKSSSAVKEIALPVGFAEDGQVIFAHVRFDAPLKKEMLASLRTLLDAVEKTLN